MALLPLLDAGVGSELMYAREEAGFFHAKHMPGSSDCLMPVMLKVGDATEVGQRKGVCFVC